MKKLKKINSIRELRKALMLTQVEFAEKLGVQQPIISSWERGGHGPSLGSYKKLLKMAKQKGFILEIE